MARQLTLEIVKSMRHIDYKPETAKRVPIMDFCHPSCIIHYISLSYYNAF